MCYKFEPLPRSDVRSVCQLTSIDFAFTLLIDSISCLKVYTTELCFPIASIIRIFWLVELMRSMGLRLTFFSCFFLTRIEHSLRKKYATSSLSLELRNFERREKHWYIHSSPITSIPGVQYIGLKSNTSRFEYFPRGIKRAPKQYRMW